MLKFSNTTSLLALLMGLSMPLSAMMEDEGEAPKSSAVRPGVQSPQQEVWVQNLFENKYVLSGPTLVLEKLKKEVISVSLSYMKAKDNSETQSKIDVLQRIMDEESQKHYFDEDLQRLLFNIYSGGILKTSVFVNPEKTKSLLNQACEQQWSWAFWERAKLSQEHAQGELTRDHYMAANYDIPQAIQYLQGKTDYNIKTVEAFFKNSNITSKIVKTAIKSFITKWSNIGYALPLLDFCGRYQLYYPNSVKDQELKDLVSQAHDFLCLSTLKGVSEFLLLKRGREFSEKQQPETAQKYFFVAAQRGNIKAINNLGIILQNREKLFEAEFWFARAAEDGQLESKFNLALMFQEQGKLQEAERLYRQAAEGKYVGAMNNLALMFQEHGKLQEAERLYRQAAETGDLGSVCSLASMLEKQGRSEEAEQFYRQAAEGKHVGAMNNLAIILKKRGELKEAEELYRQAASGGFAVAMYNLGVICYEKGDLVGAKKWWRQGETPHAMHNLAVILAKSNRAESKSLYRKASILNYSNSMVQLAMLYLEEGNITEADFWLNKAASLGDENAKNLLETTQKVHVVEESQDILRKSQENSELEANGNGDSDTLDQEIDSIFTKIENIEPLVAGVAQSNVTGQSNTEDIESISSDDEIEDEPATPEIHEVVPEVIDTPDFNNENNAGETEHQYQAYNKKKIQNPKTRREMLKALGQRQAEVQKLAQAPNRELKHPTQEIANAILSGNSDHVQRDHLETLFQDPLFLGQVRVIPTKSGFTVLAHNGNRNINTGTHRKHGQEKFTGHIHPGTRKDLKDILALFGVTQK